MDCFEHVPVRVVYSSRDRMSPRRCAAWMVQLLRQCGTESLLTEAGDLPSGLPAGVRLGSTSGLPEETRPDWLHIRPVNGGLLLTAGSEIAYSAALDALEKAWRRNLPVQAFSGSIAELSGGRNTDAYLERNPGEWRLIFSNVLFDDLQRKPNPERNRLCAGLLDRYCPDAVAMQECGPYLREPCGPDDIARLMRQAGYAETVPPVAENPDRTNYTPIFYRSDRLRLLESAYHHYRHQAPGISADDFSSKGMTWAVFEHIALRQRLILLNTHFCTQSDVPRLLQAGELIGICQRLCEKYPDTPVLLGGDFNTVLDSMTYRRCIEQGFADCIFLSTGASPRYRAHHAYPKFDPEFGMMMPDGDIGGSFEQSVDHILYLGPPDRLRISTYGMMTNRIARSFSDHCPVWLDFSFSKTLEGPAS